jgi:protein subunit release factor A
VPHEDELKIDIYRSSGATALGAWGVRVTHLPSGIEATDKGEFAAGDHPSTVIEKATERLKAEIDARLEDA